MTNEQMTRRSLTKSNDQTNMYCDWCARAQCLFVSVQCPGNRLQPCQISTDRTFIPNAHSSDNPIATVLGGIGCVSTTLIESSLDLRFLMTKRSPSTYWPSSNNSVMILDCASTFLDVGYEVGAHTRHRNIGHGIAFFP